MLATVVLSEKLAQRTVMASLLPLPELLSSPDDPHAPSTSPVSRIAAPTTRPRLNRMGTFPSCQDHRVPTAGGGAPTVLTTLTLLSRWVRRWASAKPSSV